MLNLGKTPEARIDNLVSILDGYAGKGEAPYNFFFGFKYVCKGE